MEAQFAGVAHFVESLGSKTKAPQAPVEAVRYVADNIPLLLKSAPEKLLENVLNLFIARFQSLASDKASHQEITAFINAVAASGKEKAIPKMRAFINLFNVLIAAENTPADILHNVFMALVRFAVECEELDALLPQLGGVNQWIGACRWNVDQQRSALMLLAESVEASHPSKANAFYLAYLETFQKQSITDKAKSAAKKALAFAIKSPLIYQFENLLVLDAVQAVKDDTLFHLITIFTTGDLATYKTFSAKHASDLKVAGITADDGIRKIRLLMLANLAANNLAGAVTYEQVSKTLELSEDFVEPWIIDGIRAGIIEAKIDQLARKIFITRALFRNFGNKEWDIIGKKLNEWNSNMGSMLEEITKAKQMAYLLETDGSLKACDEPSATASGEGDSVGK